jgi:hypothetical protein
MKIYKVYCTYEVSDCDDYQYWDVESLDKDSSVNGLDLNSYHLTEEGAQAQLQKIQTHERWGHQSYVWNIREITLEP